MLLQDRFDAYDIAKAAQRCVAQRGCRIRAQVQRLGVYEQSVSSILKGGFKHDGVVDVDTGSSGLTTDLPPSC